MITPSTETLGFAHEVRFVASLFMFSLMVKLFPLLDTKFCYNEKNDTYVRFIWDLVMYIDDSAGCWLVTSCLSDRGEIFLRFLGIDPGIAIVGFGFVDKVGSKVVPVQYGCIQTEAHTPEEDRLLHVYEGMLQLIDKYKPDAVALEKLFFNRNVTTAMSVSQARGVLVLAAKQRNLPIGEYTPMQVKQAIVGYGKAEKKQVQEMVRMFLKLQAVPKPDDVADALAVAICHAHSYGLNSKLNEVLRK
ncbi:Crossover junction endodeoxyribonuclease ruvC [Paenibacillus polymyxa]|uniref:Crossover junction endodeoxyribonuclease RuvC n=1 Tax=Paenibacillus polymyxa TaxID=1406 RepID=A0A378Y4Y1_PAEPO|nr:Crossover junction endodeoxyribonuclease ruvC [Paenibacillus polymyxa]